MLAARRLELRWMPQQDVYQGIVLSHLGHAALQIGLFKEVLP